MLTLTEKINTYWMPQQCKTLARRCVAGSDGSGNSSDVSSGHRDVPGIHSGM